MLFFIAGDDADTLKIIAEDMKTVRSQMTFNRIEVMKHALQVKKEAANHRNGVFFMKSTLGRGIDFRFA